MFETLINIFRIPELRNKVLFTLLMLGIYRIGYHVPLPGVDQTGFKTLADRQAQAAKNGGDESAAARLASYVSLFSGGNLSQSTIFGLGIMPYISASIIFQLLTTVLPALEKLQ
jgi:preprotein translocase subunit SecY